MTKEEVKKALQQHIYKAGGNVGACNACPYQDNTGCLPALFEDALFYLQGPAGPKISGGTLQLLAEAQDLAMATLQDLTDTINMLNITMRDAQANKEEATNNGN